MPLKLRFASPYGTLTSFGTTMSLIGMPLFSLSLILSGRFKFFEDFFGGMNKVYVAHHLVGGIAFILLMIHPLFLAATRVMVSWRTAAEFFLPSNDWSLNFALLSLYSMMLLLILTYFVKLRYQLWRLTHKFMGVAFTFGTLHVLLVQSDVSVNPYLKYYLLSLSVLGILVYCYRTLFGSALVKRHTFTVLAVEKVGADVWNVRMRNPADKFSYLPGQFVFVSFYGMGISDEVHPFSISSSPTDIDLTLTIKSSGDFTKKLYTSLKEVVLVLLPYFITDAYHPKELSLYVEPHVLSFFIISSFLSFTLSLHLSISSIIASCVNGLLPSGVQNDQSLALLLLPRLVAS
jgi:predicted ferric reductase